MTVISTSKFFSRASQIELLMSESKSLKQQKQDMESKCDKQEGYIKSAKEEISRLEAALFNAMSEVSYFVQHRRRH